MSYVELGEKYHMDLRTAKQYVESPRKPKCTLSEPKPTKMPYSAPRKMGFEGGCSIVKAYSRKMDLNEKAMARFKAMPRKLL